MLVGLVGFIGSGKNTVADRLVSHQGFSIDSFAKTLKDVVSTIFDWDRTLLEGNTEEGRLFRETVDEWWADKLGIPDFTPRYALQHIGTDLFRNNFHTDIWVLTLLRRLSKGGDVILSDARFINELDLIRNAGGKIIRVTRGEDPEWLKVAKSANAGGKTSAYIMETKYKDVHVSEWGWVGCEVDHVIENNGSLADLYRNIMLYLVPPHKK